MPEMVGLKCTESGGFFPGMAVFSHHLTKGHYGASTEVSKELGRRRVLRSTTKAEEEAGLKPVQRCRRCRLFSR